MAIVVEGRAVQGDWQPEDEDGLDELSMEEPQEGDGVCTFDNSDNKDYGHDTEEESNDENEGLQPTNDESCISVSVKAALKPAHEQNPKLDTGQPRCLISPISMQVNER